LLGKAWTAFGGIETTSWATLALVHLKRREGSEALESAEQGLSRFGSTMWVTSLLRLIKAEALHSLNRLEDARVAIGEARDRLMRIATSLAAHPTLRESYLTGIGCHARTLQLASEWLGS
jgi:hypothetical protein